uniref:Reverse transcriptase domain-containing protein n=1 Tax=Strongyloides venezuelensis TaxID=75913 RepID=A0A0K0G1C5_STRVS
MYENGIIEFSDAIKTCFYYLLTKRLYDSQQQFNNEDSPRQRFFLDVCRINAATQKIVQQSPHLTTIIGSILVRGPKNSSFIFQRSIERIISPIKDAQVFVYIDDLLILTNSTSQSYYDAVVFVIICLHGYGLKKNISKCEFYQESITYLG